MACRKDSRNYRTIQRLVENELSRLVLGGEVEPGDRVTISAKGDELTFDVERGAAEELVEAKEKEEAEKPEPAHRA